MSRKRGIVGEKLAVKELEKKGYEILYRNYRYQRAEVDIVAKNDDVVVFVEVKQRRSDQFGFPESFVGKQKMTLYTQAAEHFIESERWHGELRFDIIAISGDLDKSESEIKLEHFEDVYYPED